MNINLNDLIYGPPNRKQRRRRDKLEGKLNKHTFRIIQKAENIQVNEDEDGPK